MFVPSSFRLHWRNVIVREFPHVFDSEIDCISPCYDDVSERVEKFDRVHRELKLADIVEAYTGLMPDVLCPWGCCDYVYNCDDVEFEHVFDELVWRGRWTCVEKGSKSMSFRRDFLDGDFCAHLFNSKWQVRPAIAFVPGKGPCFLTCKLHGGGTYEKYFHLPKSLVPLVPSHGDHIGHVTLKSNVVGTVKAHKFSHTYQMNECQGSYSGIDTCRVTEQRRFDFLSHVSELSESLVLADRPDIRGLLDELVKVGKIQRATVDNMIDRRDEYFGSRRRGELERCKRGGTFMSLRDTVKLYRCRGVSKRRTILEHKMGEAVEKEVDMKWPVVRVGIHEYDSFGSAPQSVLISDGERIDVRLVWLLEALLCQVPQIWECTSDIVRDSNEWHGHMLHRITRGGYPRAKKYVFANLPFGIKSTKENTMGRNEKLLNLLQESTNYSRAVYGEADDRVVDFMSGFKPSQIRSLLEGAEYNKLCSILPSPSNVGDLVDCLSREEKEMVMIYRDDDADAVDYEVPLDCGAFELVFVARSGVISGSRKCFKWNGEICSRHSGGMFEGFWRQGNKSRMAMKLVNRSGGVDMNWIKKFRDFDVAVYAKKTPESVSKMRDEYFSFMGGQKECCCDRHRMPLVSCRRDKERTCSAHKEASETSYCKKQCSFCCPVDGCSVAVCHGCMGRIKESACIDPIYIGTGNGVISREIACNVGAGKNTVTGDAESNDVEVGPCKKRQRTEGEERGGEVDAEGGIEFDDDSSVSSCESMLSLESGVQPTGGEVLGEELESDDDGTVMEEGGGDDFPTTIYGNKGVIITQAGVSKERSIRGTGILNVAASLLTRERGEISGTREERGFVQRLAMQETGNTVPIAYPEAMMFPSVFWASAGNEANGAFVGSIPLPLMCRSESRKDVEMASILDHVKTRIMSPLNFAGSHADYCSFMFDMGANSELSQQDSRVVLRRGFAECMTATGMRTKKRDENFFTDSIDNREVVHELCAAQRENRFTLFLTNTCNQSEHFGVKHIKEWIDEVESGLQAYKDWYAKMFPGTRSLNDDDDEDIMKSLREQGRVLLLRNWLEVRKILQKN